MGGLKENGDLIPPADLTQTNDSEPLDLAGLLRPYLKDTQLPEDDRLTLHEMLGIFTDTFPTAFTTIDAPDHGQGNSRRDVMSLLKSAIANHILQTEGITTDRYRLHIVETMLGEYAAGQFILRDTSVDSDSQENIFAIYLLDIKKWDIGLVLADTDRAALHLSNVTANKTRVLAVVYHGETSAMQEQIGEGPVDYTFIELPYDKDNLRAITDIFAHHFTLREDGTMLADLYEGADPVTLREEIAMRSRRSS